MMPPVEVHAVSDYPRGVSLDDLCQRFNQRACQDICSPDRHKAEIRVQLLKDIVNAECEQWRDAFRLMGYQSKSGFSVSDKELDAGKICLLYTLVYGPPGAPGRYSLDFIVEEEHVQNSAEDTYSMYKTSADCDAVCVTNDQAMPADFLVDKLQAVIKRSLPSDPWNRHKIEAQVNLLGAMHYEQDARYTLN